MSKETDNISDGWHTFGELYEHRNRLFIALCKTRPTAEIWRSKLHSDGTGIDGWFLLGMHKEKGKQISYHLPNSLWEETNFASTLDIAPDFDGHTSFDTLERLKRL